MRLEDEIKQQRFKNEHVKAGINVLYTASYLHNLQAKNFKKFGVTGPQYNILRILRGQFPNPATVNLLIDRMLDKSSNASRIVEKLRIKKLVERVQCPDDRRAVNVIITIKGQELLTSMDNIETDFLGNIKNLTEEEATRLNQLLDKLRG